MQMAELERIDPDGQPLLDKLEHIRGAVLHHMYEEEKSWFLELKEKAEDEAFLTQRFKEEYQRYVGDGGEGDSGRIAEPRSFDSGLPTTGELDRH
jgi:hypothetical protein